MDVIVVVSSGGVICVVKIVKVCDGIIVDVYGMSVDVLNVIVDDVIVEVILVEVV